jgi:2-polyprenyl-3-methyl-5-hydroxy-6-metoxy-1,4-benzoquinol methylase
MELQVKKEHYDFNKYVDESRWNSYYHQINEVAKCKWKSVLLIWVWDWIVVNVLKKIWKEVTTFDYDKSLNPDIVWDVTKIDQIITKKYDIVVCCQVLEHIPFEMFEPTIKRISNIINEKFILSLPNRNYRIRIFAPIIRHVKIRVPKFWKNSWDFNKDWNWEHYREIDATKKYSSKKIKNIINQHFNIINTYIPFNNTYHEFFILWKFSKNHNDWSKS